MYCGNIHSCNAQDANLNRDLDHPVLLKVSFLSHLSIHDNSVMVYTDGSKREGDVTAATTFPDCNLSHSLPLCSTFTAKWWQYSWLSQGFLAFIRGTHSPPFQIQHELSLPSKTSLQEILWFLFFKGSVVFSIPGNFFDFLLGSFSYEHPGE